MRVNSCENYVSNLKDLTGCEDSNNGGWFLYS